MNKKINARVTITFKDIISKLKYSLNEIFRKNNRVAQLAFLFIIFSTINLVVLIYKTVIYLVYEEISSALLSLDTNQILYIFSTLAQVNGALLGLLIAGYTIIDSKLKLIGDSDSTKEEAINSLGDHIFVLLRKLIISIIFVVIFSVAILVFYPKCPNALLYSLIYQSFIVFLYILILTSYLVAYINPKKIYEIISNQKSFLDTNSIDAKPEEKTSPSMNYTIDTFISDYNDLTELIRNYASQLTKCHLEHMYLNDALGILNRRKIGEEKILNDKVKYKIQEISKYYNSLINMDKEELNKKQITISEKNSLVLKPLYLYIEKIANIDKDGKSKNEKLGQAIKELNEYSNKFIPSENGKKILEYLAKDKDVNEQKSATILELANHIQLTRSETINIIESLEALNLIVNTGTEKRTKWALPK